VASSLVVVVGGLLGLGFSGSTAAASSMWNARRRPYVSGSYSPLDPDRPNPLRHLLIGGFAGAAITVGLSSKDDVCLLGAGGDGRSVVDASATLWTALMDPLAAAANHCPRASVSGTAERRSGQIRPGQSEPAMLFIDVASADPAEWQRAYELLHRRLADYADILTSSTDGALRIGAVTVVVTATSGSHGRPSAEGPQYAFRDGSFGDIGSGAAPANAVPVVSAHWSWLFGWDGRGDMPGEERHQLRSTVRAAHADGRLVRIYGFPQHRSRLRRNCWRELVAAGVDLVEVPHGSLGELRGLLGGAKLGPASGPADAQQDTDQYAMLGV